MIFILAQLFLKIMPINFIKAPLQALLIFHFEILFERSRDYQWSGRIHWKSKDWIRSLHRKESASIQ